MSIHTAVWMYALTCLLVGLFLLAMATAGRVRTKTKLYTKKTTVEDVIEEE